MLNLFSPSAPQEAISGLFSSLADTQVVNQRQQAAAAALQYERELSAMNAANEFSAEQAKLNREWQTAANEKAMRFEAEQAAVNRNWQAQQTNTAYQRAVADLREAGLNPILAALSGGSASGAGAQASGVTSAGSAATAVKANASKADVDVATYREMYNNYITSARSMVNTAVSSLGRLLSGIKFRR